MQLSMQSINIPSMFGLKVIAIYDIQLRGRILPIECIKLMGCQLVATESTMTEITRQNVVYRPVGGKSRRGRIQSSTRRSGREPEEEVEIPQMEATSGLLPWEKRAMRELSAASMTPDTEAPIKKKHQKPENTGGV